MAVDSATEVLYVKAVNAKLGGNRADATVSTNLITFDASALSDYMPRVSGTENEGGWITNRVVYLFNNHPNPSPQAVTNADRMLNTRVWLDIEGELETDTPSPDPHPVSFTLDAIDTNGNAVGNETISMTATSSSTTPTNAQAENIVGSFDKESGAPKTYGQNTGAGAGSDQARNPAKHINLGTIGPQEHRALLITRTYEADADRKADDLIKVRLRCAYESEEG